MLLLLAPIAWLAVMTLFAALCRMAAHGDVAAMAAPPPAAAEHSRPFRDGLAVWEGRATASRRAAA